MFGKEREAAAAGAVAVVTDTSSLEQASRTNEHVGGERNEQSQSPRAGSRLRSSDTHARTHTHAYSQTERVTESERERDTQASRQAGNQAHTRIGRMIRQQSLLKGATSRRRSRKRRRRRRACGDHFTCAYFYTPF